MKHGKPASVGCKDSTPILGVPGYPVSGIIVIEQLLKPLVDCWLKSSAEKSRYANAVLTRPVVSGLKYQEFVRVRMGYVGDKLMASPLNRGSGVVSSFMKKYFPKGGVKLIRCVGRQQGLMVAKGNPLNIESFADIAKAGLRYVNRQKGSGTRILTDYLCKQNGLDTAAIYGYAREELTRPSVAAQIVSGSADAGMGIYSAAKLYDLDFIPICIEEYDLIIPDHACDTPQVQAMIETLGSVAFREKILSLGGYTVENPGEIIELI